MQYVQLTANLSATQCVGAGSYRSSKDVCSTCGAGKKEKKYLGLARKKE
jgi:ribosomal protein L37E